MKADLSFRAASTNDVKALLDLYTYLSSDNERYPIDRAKNNISMLEKYVGSAVLIGELGGRIITTCTLVIIPNLTRGGAPYALIENVVTHPDHRGKGFGKSLLEMASNRAWEFGCYKVMLSTGSKAPSTVAFYESAGFEQSRTGFQKRRLAPRSE